MTDEVRSPDPAGNGVGPAGVSSAGGVARLVGGDGPPAERAIAASYAWNTSS